MYPKNEEKELSVQLFASPSNEYRGAPFWAWNQRLDPETLCRHIDYFREMGIGGFHMHCRTGLDTPYMGEEYRECVKLCVEKAKKEGMFAYLYDEDRWPSGAAGGLVTKEERYRSRYLVFTCIPNEDRRQGGEAEPSTAAAQVQGNGKLLARYEIRLEGGFLMEYRRLPEGEGPGMGGRVWYLYEEISRESPWYNNQTYVDTLNREAILRFIEETHEQYLNCVGKEFGGVVPSIFTDEPQFSHKTCLGFAESQEDVILPYTDGLPEGYRKSYGADFFDTVPELVWELPEGRSSVARYRFHDYVAELFSSSFADTLGSWCREHGILLTGHMMEEPTLESQTNALGEAMRSYRSFGLPGIDMLCDRREYTTAKQAQSASHQYGCPGVLSELYGVTNWDFDFRGHKLAGDWQAALGVTLRVHHLAWDSMNGEAKRDYPASIFYQSPWYREYGLIEDHFARVNTALTRGEALVRIGLIHPVESYWLHYGPKEQTAAVRAELEERFENVTKWLLFSHMDFDYVAESLLPSQYEPSEDGRLHVGRMAYDMVVVPGCETLRSSTLSCLEEFAAAGGDVIFMGEAPRLVDAMPSDRGRRLFESCRRIGFSRGALLEAVECCREVELRRDNGSVADHLLCQLRRDNDVRWLFVCNGKPVKNPDIPAGERITFRLTGQWTVEEYDTMTGDILPMETAWENGKTVCVKKMYDHTSVLLKLTPAQAHRPAECGGRAACEKEAELVGLLPEPSGYFLSEPNALLLDMAQWQLDGGPWQEKEEILRLDNLCRLQLGYPLRLKEVAQPWTEKKEAPVHLLKLRFIIRSRIRVTDACLALEDMEHTDICINGSSVEKKDAGYYVDECIRRLPLPPIPEGESELLLTIPYGRRTNVEWCYLLGSFGVDVRGKEAILTEKPQRVVFGDYTGQGFPFYAGNMGYEVTLEVPEEGEYILAAEKFRAPLLKVLVDGAERGRIAFSPYRVSLGRLEKGPHRLTLISYGNRVNAFGPVHNCNEKEDWIGPNAWRTDGPAYSYEYQLKRMGILTTPGLYRPG